MISSPRKTRALDPYRQLVLVRLTSPTPSFSRFCRSRAASVPCNQGIALLASESRGASGQRAGTGTISRGRLCRYPQNRESDPRRSSCSNARARPRMVCEVVADDGSEIAGSDAVRQDKIAVLGILHTTVSRSLMTTYLSPQLRDYGSLLLATPSLLP